MFRTKGLFELPEECWNFQLLAFKTMNWMQTGCQNFATCATCFQRRQTVDLQRLCLLCATTYFIFTTSAFLPFATWSGKFVKHVGFLRREVNSNHAAWHEAKIQKPESSTMPEEAGSRQNIYFAADVQVHKRNVNHKPTTNYPLVN